MRAVCRANSFYWIWKKKADSIVFQLKNIHKRFEQKIIAQHIDLSVQAGKMLAILGASGSGKSTLLHIAAGLQKADSGEIWLNGENITFRQPEKRKIAMMFQDFALLPHFNVWENVAFGLKLRGIAKQQAKNQAFEILEEVGILHATECHITQLSGGEQQRVALARALVVSPKLLLLDEPFSSLDTTLRQQLQQQINLLIKKRNIPAVLVSHDPAEAALSAQSIALLANGNIIQMGAPAQLFAQPNSAQAARLLGCLNVSEKYFIAPNIIKLTKNKGEKCRVLACFRQPANWRVIVQHPKWGELVAFSQNEVGEMCDVWVEESQIVQFR